MSVTPIDGSTDTSIEESQENLGVRRSKGEFVRGVSGFRNKIGNAEFPAESGRYHLFVDFNCPWCHRVTLARNVLGLQNSVTLDVAFPSRTDEQDSVGPNLWEFNPERVATLTGATLPECSFETATGVGYRLVKQIYAAQGADEASVPILYDKKTKQIVNNESAEIVRMLNEHAKALGSSITDADRSNLYPDKQVACDEIDALNKTIYTTINNGAYKAGFSSDQTVYAAAFNT